MRIVTYVKRQYPERFEQCLREFWVAYWSNGVDISKMDGASKTLLSTFSRVETEDILENSLSPENKATLLKTTREAMEKGAFGAPFIVATKSDSGESNVFWGSDRWEHIYKFLGLDYKPLELVSKL